MTIIKLSIRELFLFLFFKKQQDMVMMTKPKAKLNLEDLENMTADERQAFVDMFNGNEIKSTATPFVPATLESTSKHWLKSKTMRFNLGVLVTTVTAAVMPTLATIFPVAETMLPVAKLLMNPQGFLVLSTLVTTGNMALRKVTKEKIHFKKR